MQVVFDQVWYGVGQLGWALEELAGERGSAARSLRGTTGQPLGLRSRSAATSVDPQPEHGRRPALAWGRRGSS